jgi:hypothetical protein
MKGLKLTVKLKASAWEILQQDLNFISSSDDSVEVDDNVLTCGLISTAELCDETSEVNNTNETHQESGLEPKCYKAVIATETLRQFHTALSGVPESVMKSVGKTDTKHLLQDWLRNMKQ